MLKSAFQVAKIVASTTEFAWSQTYHAGGLTAILSVLQKDNTTEQTSLPIVGKDLLNTFESEYFTLETKNLAGIVKAVELTYKKSSDTHQISLLVAACIQNALYIVLAGTGSIYLLRKKQMGTLLTKDYPGNEDTLAASGFLEDGDTIILETSSFAKIISKEFLTQTLEAVSLEEAVETITPEIQRDHNGSEAALFFRYTEEKPFSQPIHVVQEKITEEKAEIPVISPSESDVLHVQEIQQEKKKKFTHRQMFFLTIAIILLLLLIATIYFSLKKEQEAKQAALFKSIYQPALQQYQEGQGLVNLNANEARNDFQQAITTLQSGKGKFPSHSTDEQQIETLLGNVQQSLTLAAHINTVNLQKMDLSTNPILSFEANQSTKYVTFDDTNFYMIDDKGITQYNQKTKSHKVLIKNNSDWKTVGGLGTYYGNFYVLDTQTDIIKYVAAGSGYSKTKYFAPGVAPDLSHAVSLAIDSDIWILTSDGTIMKFTRGKADNFAISGLDKQFLTPTRIVTSIDDNNIYILDSGNSRLVVISKTGSYIAQYQSQQIKQAKDMTVDEKNKKVDFLVGSDIEELTLK